MPIPVRLNIICDKQASEEREQMVKPYQLDTRIFHTQTTILILHTQLIESFKEKLWHELYNLSFQNIYNRNTTGHKQSWNIWIGKPMQH